MPTLKTKIQPLDLPKEPGFKITGSSGATLVEILISVGIMSILAVITNQTMKGLFDIWGGVKFNTDRLEVGMTLRSDMDCVKTIAAMGSSCDNKSKGSPAAVSLRDSSDNILLPKDSGRVGMAPKYTGYGTCYEEAGLWNFNASLTETGTSQGSTARTTSNVFGRLPYKCQKGSTRCTTTLPGENNTGKLWVVLFGDSFPANSGWCSGKGHLQLPVDATNIRVQLVGAFADDWGARIKINNQIVWNEPNPFPWFGGGPPVRNPNLDISSFFVAGDNTITVRGFDTSGGYCGAGLLADISYDTNSGCNPLTYVSECQEWGLACDPETTQFCGSADQNQTLFSCRPRNGGPAYITFIGSQLNMAAQCRNPIAVCNVTN